MTDTSSDVRSDMRSDALIGRRIAFIGGGAMGEALIGGLLQAGVPREHVTVADPDPGRRKAVEERLRINTTESNEEAVAEADVAVLAVKPDKVATVLADLDAGEADLTRPLWISIAAGVSLAKLEAGLPAGARVVRAMPNTPAQVHSGATGFVANAHAGDEDRELASALFEAVGIAWEAPREELLDAVTGLSGSGPAYVFLLLEALTAAGQNAGLPTDAAGRLASQTVFGAAKLALESGRPPAELREQVSSPGGTTLAGLARLEELGLREAIDAAVAAATARSKELGKE